MSVEAVRTFEQLAELRRRGWSVAVHNDYWQDGLRQTFWLFTRNERFVKGEGPTDLVAIAEALLDSEKLCRPNHAYDFHHSCSNCGKRRAVATFCDMTQEERASLGLSGGDVVKLSRTSKEAQATVIRLLQDTRDGKIPR